MTSHGGHSVDLLIKATSAIRPRPSVLLGRVDYDSLAPSLRSGLLLQTTWALNTLVVMTASEAVRLPPGRPNEPLTLALALAELFWADVQALGTLPLAPADVHPAPPTPCSDACPSYVACTALDAAEVEEEVHLDVHRHRRQLLTDRLISVATIVRNWMLTAEYRAPLANDAAIVTVLLWVIAGDLPHVPARTRRLLRTIAWDAFASLGQLLRVPGPATVGDGAPSPLEVVVLACTDALETQMAMVRDGVMLTQQDAAETRTYLDVAMSLTLTNASELARCPPSSLTALVRAVVSTVQPLQDGSAVRAEVQVWANNVFGWLVEVALLLLLNLIRLPIPPATARQHGPIGRVLLTPIALRVIVLLGTRNPAQSAGYAEAQRLSLRILRELAVLPEAHRLLAPHESALLAISAFNMGRGQRGTVPVPSLASDVLFALSMSAAEP